MKKFLALLLLGLCLAGFARAEDAVVEADAVAISDDGENSDANTCVDKFKEELAPDGKWVQVKTPDYNWVWVPNIATHDPDWRPYVHGGHWEYTDAGWYWNSDYAWGTVCFHYGRWVSTEFGWAWVPGSQWAPAWVCWRECDTHYAWAPLPPCTHFSVGAGFFLHGKHCEAGFGFGFGVDDYCFVPCGAFLEVDIWKHHCHHDECIKVYNKTVIQNTYVYRNKVIVNNCFRKEVVEARVHAKIEVHVVAKVDIERSHKIEHEARVARNAHANHEAIRETREARKDAHVVRHEDKNEQKVEKREQHKEVQKQKQEQRKEVRQQKQEQRKEVRQQKQEQHKEVQQQRREVRQAPPVQHSAPVQRSAPVQQQHVQHSAPPVQHSAPPPPQHSAPAPVQHHR